MLSLSIVYPVSKVFASEGKKVCVSINEKDLVPGSKSMAKIKFFFDELPEGVAEGCRIAFVGVTSSFSVNNVTRVYEPEDGKKFYIKDMCINGAKISVING